MKKLLLLASILASHTLIQSNAKAEPTCAKVATKVLFLGKEESSIGLLKHNGKYIHPPLNETKDFESRRGINSSVLMSMSLEPGYHEFSAIIMNNRNKINNSSYTSASNKNSSLHNQSNKSFSINEKIINNSIHFGIEVEAGKIYRLVAKENRPKTNIPHMKYQIIAKSIKETQCDSKQVKLAIPRSIVVNHQQKLPEQLQFRLNALSKDIQAYYANNGINSATLNFHFPSRQESNFGFITATDTKPSEGLTVLAVAPLTAAAKLGLQANDNIISVNEKSITNEVSVEQALAVFKEQLEKTQLQKKLNIKIIRNNKIINLISNNSIITLPEVRFKITPLISNNTNS